MAAWIALTAGLCGITGFVYFWFGVGRTERRFEEDFDAILEAYTTMKRERDSLVKLSNDLIDGAGVLTPAERAAFDQISAQLERLS